MGIKQMIGTISSMFLWFACSHRSWKCWSLGASVPSLIRSLPTSVVVCQHIDSSSGMMPMNLYKVAEILFHLELECACYPAEVEMKAYSLQVAIPATMETPLMREMVMYICASQRLGLVAGASDFNGSMQGVVLFVQVISLTCFLRRGVHVFTDRNRMHTHVCGQWQNCRVCSCNPCVCDHMQSLPLPCIAPSFRIVPFRV